MYNYNDNDSLQQAKNAGIRALNSLQQARRSLDSARSWGIFDILGGGKVATLVKHSKVRKANASIKEARQNLLAFEHELQGVSISTVHISSFLTFMDFWQNDFFADIAVQQRINELRSEVDRTIHQVEFALSRLSI